MAKTLPESLSDFATHEAHKRRAIAFLAQRFLEERALAEDGEYYAELMEIPLRDVALVIEELAHGGRGVR